MKLVLLAFFSVATLYGMGEFATGADAYPSEFSQSRLVQKQVQINKKTAKDKQKQAEKIAPVVSMTPKSKPKVKLLSGYEQARKELGAKVLKVESKDEAKKIVKKRNDIVPMLKLNSIVYNNHSQNKMKEASLVIMMPLQKRPDGQMMYTVYLFKRVQ